MNSIRHNIEITLATIFIISGIFISYTIIVNAQTVDGIIYPIEELGDCSSESECRNYCNTPGAIDNCVRYGLANGLMTPEEGARALKFISIGEGPGGCSNGSECRSYCNDSENTQECLDFAEQHDILDSDELDNARRIITAIRDRRNLPGECTSRNDCINYCNNPSNINECIDFAEGSGFLQGKKLQKARGVAKALASGVALPGGCTGKNSCEIYCSDSANQNECLDFAEKTGLIGDHELENARKFAPLIARGETPGGCTTRDACKLYCIDSANQNECLDFAEKVGFIDRDRANTIRGTGGKGPGGCKGRIACEEFCNTIENQETCFEFAREHGFIEKEKLRDLEEGVSRLRGAIEGVPPEISECLTNTIGTNILEKIRAGEFTPGQEIGDAVKGCFERFSPNDFRNQENVDRRDNFRDLQGEFNRTNETSDIDFSSQENLNDIRRVEERRKEEIERRIREDTIFDSSKEPLRYKDDFPRDGKLEENHDNVEPTSYVDTKRFFGFILGGFSSILWR